jgi:hypothetical protein
MDNATGQVILVVIREEKRQRRTPSPKQLSKETLKATVLNNPFSCLFRLISLGNIHFLKTAQRMQKRLLQVPCAVCCVPYLVLVKTVCGGGEGDIGL